MIKNDQIILNNRKARRDYFIVESIETGIELKGSEVKSLRDGKGNISDSFAKITNGEIFLYNLHISVYSHAGIDAPDPLRTRKLLLHKHQIKKITSQLSIGKHTLVPLKLYFKKGKVKVELALAKGKKQYDKRQSVKRREHEVEVKRFLNKRK